MRSFLDRFGGPVVNFVWLATGSWVSIIKNKKTPILQQIFFGRCLDYVLSEYAFRLEHMPEENRNLCAIEIADAIKLGRRTSEFLMKLMSREGVKNVLREQAQPNCKDFETSWLILRSKTTTGSFAWEYYDPEPSPTVFENFIKAGVLDDCAAMAKLFPDDPAWPNIRWQIATRAAHWKRAAQCAAFLSTKPFRGILTEGLFDVAPLVSDTRTWPSLAAVLEHCPGKTEHADLVHRLKYPDQSNSALLEMIKHLRRMQPILARDKRTYADVMTVLK